MASNPTSAATWRTDIQVLRAVAVTAVIAGHARLYGFAGGYVGVDVFFVVSGFVITGLLLADSNESAPTRLVAFYARRARRILPAGLLVLVATLAGGVLVLDAAAARSLAGDAGWAAALAANFRFASTGVDYFTRGTEPSALQHYWSLAVEEQFYLIWPVLVGVVVKCVSAVRRRVVLTVLVGVVGVVSLVWSIAATAVAPVGAYYSPATRAYEIAAGCLVALCLPHLVGMRRRTCAVLVGAGYATIAVCVATFDAAATSFPGAFALIPVAGCVGVIVGGSSHARQHQATAHPSRRPVSEWVPVQWVGARSYELYLWHWPLLILPVTALDRPLSPLETVAAVTVSIAMAAVTYRFVSVPARNAAVVASPRRALAAGIAAVMVVVGAAGAVQARSDVGTVTVGTLQEPVTFTAESIRRDVPDSFGDGCLQLEAATDTRDCVYGDPSASTTVVLLGDSKAAMWLPALQQIAGTNPVRVVLFAKAGCSLPDEPLWNSSLGREYHECATWLSAVTAEIGVIAPDLLIVTNDDSYISFTDGNGPTWEDTNARWGERLAVRLESLRSTADDMVVLGNIPAHSDEIGDCLVGADDPATCFTPAADAISTVRNDAERAAAVQSGVPYIDVTGWLCADGVCPMIVDGHVAYLDRFHISASWATQCGPRLLEALQSAGVWP